MTAPQRIAGTPYGVQMEAKCAHTIFKNRDDYGEVMYQKVLDCTMMASWESGVLSINFTRKGQRQAVAVRLDELMLLLSEASAARTEEEEGGHGEEQ